MTALEEALDVLKDVATSGPRQRAVALARGARLLGDLSSEEKRDLAVRVAEKAAPHLVPVIEAETGRELSPQQVSAVLQMASQLDGSQVDELRAALLDDDVRSDLAAGLAADLATDLGFEIPDDLSGLDAGVTPPPTDGTPDVYPPSPPPPSSRLDIELEDPEAPALARDLEPEPPVIDEASQHEPHELDLEPLPSSFVASGGLAAAIAAVELPEPEPLISPEARELSPDLAETVVVTTTETDDEALVVSEVAVAETPAPLDARPLLDDLRAATSPRDRSARLRSTATDDLWRVGAAARLTLLAVFPDGWERRRAIHRLLEIDVVSADEAVAVARSVVDTASRRWVVGSLSEAGLLDDEQIRALVSGGTADRIEARRGG